MFLFSAANNDSQSSFNQPTPSPISYPSSPLSVQDRNVPSPLYDMHAMTYSVQQSAYSMHNGCAIGSPLHMDPMPVSVVSLSISTCMSLVHVFGRNVGIFLQYIYIMSFHFLLYSMCPNQQKASTFHHLV